VTGKSCNPPLVPASRENLIFATILLNPPKVGVYRTFLARTEAKTHVLHVFTEMKLSGRQDGRIASDQGVNKNRFDRRSLLLPLDEIEN